MRPGQPMYSSDNGDYFAWPNWDGGAADTPQGWLYLVGARIPDPFVAPWSTTGGDSAWQTRSLLEVHAQWKGFLVPGGRPKPDLHAESASQQAIQLRHEWRGLWLLRVLKSSTIHWPKRLPFGIRPACYIQWEPDENTLGPGNPGAFEFNDAANFPSAPPSGGEGIGRCTAIRAAIFWRLTGMCNSCWRQLSRRIPTLRQRSGPGPGGKTDLWWSPFSSTGH